MNNYLTRHIQSGIYSLGKLTRSPLNSLFTCLIIGIALTLPAALFVALKNAETISHSFKQSLQVTLYLKQNITKNQVDNLLTVLQKNTDIKKAQAISPADGLQELAQQAGLDSPLTHLQTNPLPWAIVIQPNENLATPELFEQFAQQLKTLPEVDNVQLDILWVKRLASFILLAHKLTYVLAFFLGMAVLLIVNNTIRSTTQLHHKEIQIIKLIGGTHAFIRRPFLYVGMMYGLIGGIIAWLLVTLLMWTLAGPSRHLAELYGSSFTMTGIGLGDFLFLLLSSVFLGLLGSWLAVSRYLYQTRDF